MTVGSVPTSISNTGSTLIPWPAGCQKSPMLRVEVTIPSYCLGVDWPWYALCTMNLTFCFLENGANEILFYLYWGDITTFQFAWFRCFFRVPFSIFHCLLRFGAWSWSSACITSCCTAAPSWSSKSTRPPKSRFSMSLDWKVMIFTLLIRTPADISTVLFIQHF